MGWMNKGETNVPVGELVYLVDSKSMPFLRMRVRVTSGTPYIGL